MIQAPSAKALPHVPDGPPISSGLLRRSLEAVVRCLLQPFVVAFLGTAAVVLGCIFIYERMPVNEPLSLYAVERHSAALAASGIRKIAYDIRSSLLRPNTIVVIEDKRGTHDLCEGPRRFCRRAAQMSFILNVAASGVVTVRADVDTTQHDFEHAAADLDHAIEDILASYQAQLQIADSWLKPRVRAQATSAP